jgi:hypothetical protein
MNLFDFLSKFGSKDHYLQIYIEHENKLKYKLKLFKTGYITISFHYNLDEIHPQEIYDANLDNGKIKVYLFGKFISFIIPRTFDYLISYEKYTLYIPQNNHNTEIYNKLVKRRDIDIDSRYPHKSKWRHFTYLKPC